MINPTPDTCFAEPSSIYGRWATDGYGRLAKIDGSIETQTGTVYYGTRVHGGSWSTRVPATIHPKDEAVLNRACWTEGATPGTLAELSK